MLINPYMTLRGWRKVRNEELTFSLNLHNARVSLLSDEDLQPDVIYKINEQISNGLQSTKYRLNHQYIEAIRNPFR